MPINFSEIEKKWQQAWEDKKIFQAKETSKKKKFYCLEMFPYPSAAFLHMGHVRNYTIGDIIARFKRMQGFNVLYTMGYDSFGLPAENAAKKSGIRPKKYTEDAIKKITEYFKALGNSYDWSRVISTHQPEYYKWNQYFFLKFLERGLVYRKKAPVNWCPDCSSVLANEEVVDGKCWRHEDTIIESKELEQWFLKTTAYADELLKDLDKLKWSERIKNLQKNWIGKSEGTLTKFKLKNKEVLEVFTTRIDTIFSVTFLVMAPEHPKVLELVKGTKYKLRDWLISRQRYWGTPIPIVYCNKCGTVAVNQLPVLLPEEVDFKKEGNPLNHNKSWVETKCPICNGNAKRETDTMGGFVDSSWYFLRFCSPQDNKNPFDKKAVSYWIPVDQYIGGIEHAVGHLIYSRFFTKAERYGGVTN